MTITCGGTAILSDLISAHFVKVSPQADSNLCRCNFQSTLQSTVLKGYGIGIGAIFNYYNLII